MLLYRQHFVIFGWQLTTLECVTICHIFWPRKPLTRYDHLLGLIYWLCSTGLKFYLWWVICIRSIPMATFACVFSLCSWANEEQLLITIHVCNQNTLTYHQVVMCWLRHHTALLTPDVIFLIINSYHHSNLTYCNINTHTLLLWTCRLALRRNYWDNTRVVQCRLRRQASSRVAFRVPTINQSINRTLHLCKHKSRIVVAVLKIRTVRDDDTN